MFEELYNVLKEENRDKICFVEIGSFFVALGSDAEYISMVLELAKTCYGNNICKVGFPNNSLSKYIEIFHNMRIPYVVYGYMIEETFDLKVEIECNDKKYVKLAESNDNDIRYNQKREEILKIYSSFRKIDCSKCSYRRVKVVKEIASCEKRIARLKLELKNLVREDNSSNIIFDKNEINLFDMIEDNMCNRHG